MKHGCKYIAELLFFLLLLSGVRAQVAVHATIDRDSILIGQPASITLEVYAPLGTPVQWVVTDTIPHFEVLKQSAVDTIENIDGKKIVQTITITGFDEGSWEIAPFGVMADGLLYYSDTIRLKVTFTPFDPDEEYHDIKDIIEIPNPSTEYIVPLLLGAALVCLLLLYIILRRKKSAVSAGKKEAPLLTPYEEAMKALGDLDKQGVVIGGEKIYYTAMNDILKNYLARKFAISSFERTNEELIIQLSGLSFSRENFLDLSQTLRIADFVKFAKFKPSPEDNSASIVIIRTSIEKLDNHMVSAV